MPVKLNGSTSGSVTLAAPATGTDVSLTLPTTEIATTAGVATAVAPMGLVAVAPTSIANSGGSASLSGYTVSFSGVSSISLNGVFTGDYDNYRILVNIVGSSNTNFRMRFRVAGTDNSGSNYTREQLQLNNTALTASLSASQTSFAFGNVATERGFVTMDVADAFSANAKNVQWQNSRSGASGIVEWGTGYFSFATSMDGFTIYPGSGTITGTVSVYGYKK